MPMVASWRTSTRVPADGTVDRLTLDANLLHEYWKQRPRKAAVEKLLDLAGAGSVDLAVTRYVLDDFPDSEGLLAGRLAELPELRISQTGGVFTLDVSGLDGPDGLGDQDFLDLQYEIVASWPTHEGKPPDGRDWMHLHAHSI
jgi:hypothetical protein